LCLKQPNSSCTQLDKITYDSHRRVIHGVDADSKLLVLHCDFSQDLAHAMTDQCMCEYFDIIASSLFICVAHFWDSVTNKRECKGAFLFFISNFLSPFWPNIFHFPVTCPGWLFIFAQQQSSESVWNNRSMKVFLLQHNTPVPTGQFNDTAFRVPNNNLLCSRRGCRCLKQHLLKVDSKCSCGREKGRDPLLRSILVKDDQCKHEKDYVVFHLPKSQVKFRQTLTTVEFRV